MSRKALRLPRVARLVLDPLAERLLVPILGGVNRGFWWSLEFELLVILPALRFGPQEAYTVSIAEHIRSRTGNEGLARRSSPDRERRARPA